MTISQINDIYNIFKPYLIKVLEVSNDRYVIECKKEAIEIKHPLIYSYDLNENSVIISCINK